jgi:phage terminase large subunit
MSGVSEGARIDEITGAEERVTRIVIPYAPRRHFIPMHNSQKRWLFNCSHRRAGKTVAICNHIIRRAVENQRTFPPPRYGYIGPSFAQAKDLVWGYFKHYTSVLPGVKVSEGDLQLILPTGAMINLYGGAAAYERMRGLYFDGIAADEYPLLNPSMLGSVVRPCLADYRGWGIISGTSNGDDHFHELKKRADKSPDQWDEFIIPVNETDALDPEEVAEMKKDMTDSEFAREMMCNFDAPIEGSYYGEVINDISLNNQITGVPYDPSGGPVVTWWDLGIDDETFIWFVQQCGRELHVIDCVQNTGKGLEFYATQIKNKPYHYGAHVLPHDIKARELGTGKSRYEILLGFLPNLFICPDHKVEDGIVASRATLRMCYFDARNCEPGLSALKNYHKTATGKPLHNWASHGADAFRVGSVALRQVLGMIGGNNVVQFAGALKRRLRRMR